MCKLDNTFSVEFNVRRGGPDLSRASTRTYVVRAMSGDRGEYSLGRLAKRAFTTAEDADRAARSEAKRRDIPGAYWEITTSR